MLRTSFPQTGDDMVRQKSDNSGGSQPYQAPRVETLSSQELLSQLGPALAIYGAGPDLNP